MTPIEVARRELAKNVKETTGRNDGYPAETYSFGEAVPWCSSFVAYCFREAGQDLPGNKWHLRSVQRLEEYLCDMGAEVSEPRPGDIVTFDDRGGSDSGPGRHVGIVEEVKGGVLVTIEGNVGNTIKRLRHDAGSPRISKFLRWPL